MFGNIVINFTEVVPTKFLKIHSRFEERDENNQIIGANTAQFTNYLCDIVKVYQLAEEGKLEYDYDVVGNRTEMRRIVGGVTERIIYHYDSGGARGNGRRLLYETIIGADGVERNLWGYEYDANGNLAAKSNRFTIVNGEVNLYTSGIGINYWQYCFDVQDRLVRVVHSNGLVVEYKYDPSSRRIISNVGQEIVQYGYSILGQVIFEKGATGTQKYISANGKMLASIQRSEQTTVQYFHSDNLGSNQLITSEAGQVTTSTDYLPFGEDLLLNRASGGSGSNYKYTGQYQQAEIGLYYYGARFYDPEIGRFISEDSLSGELNLPQTQHLFVYVNNNPLKFIDPTGNAAEVANDSNWKIVKSYTNDTYSITKTIFQNSRGELLYSTLKKSSTKDIITNTYVRANGKFDHMETKTYDHVDKTFTHKVDAIAKDGKSGDKTNTWTLAGTDSASVKQEFVKANLVTTKLESYSGLLRGVREEIRGIETGIELIPLDNVKNWFGISVGVDINQAVVKGGAYFETDFKESNGKGLTSFGIGGQATLAEANIHGKVRFGELNIYGNFGGEVFGFGGMLDLSLGDRRSDGTLHLMTFDGLLQFIFGINVNIDIYVKERECFQE